MINRFEDKRVFALSTASSATIQIIINLVDSQNKSINFELTEMPAAANGSELVGALGLLKPMEANGSELRGGGALFDFPNKSPRPPSPPPPELANGSALVLANGSAAGLEGPEPNGSTDAVVALPAPPPFMKANMSLSLLFDGLPPKISVEGCAGLPPETPEKMSFTSWSTLFDSADPILIP